RTYRFTYAKDWTRVSRHGIDLTVESPDRSAEVVSLSRSVPKHTTSVTAQDMRALVSEVGKEVGTVTGKPVYHAVRYKGVIRRTASFTFRTPQGAPGSIFLVGAVHRHRACVLGGLVFNTAQATANRDSARVSAMISSLVFA